MLKVAYVMAGGALGSALRYGASVWFTSPAGKFPMATFLVNVLGCVLFGFIAAWVEEIGLVSEELRLFLLVGILGGFTTFSSFGFETMRLFEGGQVNIAIAYILLSNALGILAAFGAYRMGLQVFT
jgi:CrcB protein